ncbi:MAG: DUF5615 family PIN-like protein [Bauldia sp.]|nr:DUF5615 family PIN-like protein [Bauldia sp.]
MRWLADECVDLGLVLELRRLGEDVEYVSETSPGATDDDVLEIAHAGSRLLLTVDKDFGELVVRQARPVPGLVLLRLGTANWISQAARVSVAISRQGTRLHGHYTVVEDGKIRSRPLPRASVSNLTET